MSISDKIDQIAAVIKDAATELEEEVAKMEDATTTIYKSLKDIISSVAGLSDTVWSAVEKNFGDLNADKEEDQS